MACFSARVRFYKALLGLEIFDGRREFFVGEGERELSKALERG